MRLSDILTDELPLRRDEDGGPAAMLNHAKTLAGFGPPPEPESRDLAILDAMKAALDEGGEEAARGVLATFLGEPEVRSSRDWRNEPEPRPVLSRASEGSEPVDAVLSVGEVAVLTGRGQGGKSHLALKWMVEGNLAAERGDPFIDVCGMRVQAGRGMMVSYEDSAKRIDQRVVAIAGVDADVMLLPVPRPMFEFDWRSQAWVPAPYWPRVWATIHKSDPDFVVIDTGPKALGGQTNDGEAVIPFVRELEIEAKRGGFGVLVTAHDTKAARDAVAQGETPPAGAIAGSSQWHDSPRGVMHLTQLGLGDAPRILQVIKCSYGHDGWGALLEPVYREGDYAGMTLRRTLESDEVERERSAGSRSSGSRRRNESPGRRPSGHAGKGVLWE